MNQHLLTVRQPFALDAGKGRQNYENGLLGMSRVR